MNNWWLVAYEFGKGKLQIYLQGLAFNLLKQCPANFKRLNNSEVPFEPTHASHHCVDCLETLLTPVTFPGKLQLAILHYDYANNFPHAQCCSSSVILREPKTQSKIAKNIYTKYLQFKIFVMNCETVNVA